MSLLSWFKRAVPSLGSPRLESLVSRCADYLASRPSDSEFLPKIVGKAIGESELAAMTALSMLERRGVTKHHFGVYCGDTGVPLGSFDDLSQIKQEPYYCEICDEHHSSEDEGCKVEIYFTVDASALATYRRRSAA